MCYENKIPRDSETVLKNAEYKRTKLEVKGARVYKKGKYYYHRDTLHGGKSAHLEVYDKRGKHIGKANPNTGEIIPNTAVSGRKIKLWY